MFTHNAVAIYAKAAKLPRNVAWMEQTQIWGFNCLVAKDWQKGRAIRCGAPITEQHHVFIRDSKKHKRWVDHPVNQQLSCHTCNADTRVADRDINTLVHLASVLEIAPDVFGEWWELAPEGVREFNPRYRKVNNWYQSYLDGGVQYMLEEWLSLAARLEAE